MHLILYLGLLILLCKSSHNTMDLEILKQKDEKQTGSFIFLHGATRNGKWQKEMFMDYLGDRAHFKHIKVIFPTSPVQNSVKHGKPTNLWFGPQHHKINPNKLLSELNEATETVKSIVMEEQKIGIPLNRIILGGISQGGMLAIHSTYSSIPEVAACIAVSSVVPHDKIFEDIKSRPTNPPLFMYHGIDDEIIPISMGKEAYKKMSESGIVTEFQEIEGAPHELTPEELELIYERINILIPEKINLLEKEKNEL